MTITHYLKHVRARHVGMWQFTDFGKLFTGQAILVAVGSADPAVTKHVSVSTERER